MPITLASAFTAFLQLAAAPFRRTPAHRDGCALPFAGADTLSAHELRDVGLEPAELARERWQLY